MRQKTLEEPPVVLLCFVTLSDKDWMVDGDEKRADLLGEEVVELCGDALAKSVLVLVVHLLVQVGQLVVFNHLLHT